VQVRKNQLEDLFKLLINESKEALDRMAKEETTLLKVCQELNNVPLPWKVPCSYLLEWIRRNLFRRKFFKKVGDEITEIERVRKVVSCHLAYCDALHYNISKMSFSEMGEALGIMLEKWYVDELQLRHRIKFINFPSEVRLYNIRQLSEQLSA